MRLLCRLNELSDPGAKGFELAGPDGVVSRLFVVRRGTEVFAYHNRCPHTGAPLEWQPDQFLDVEGRLIQCALHGARFRIEDGRCLSGPCAGDSLQALPVAVSAGVVVLVG